VLWKFFPFSLQCTISLAIDLFDPTDLSIHQADLDTVRVIGRIGQDVFDDSFNKFSAGLILLAHDAHAHTGFDVGTYGSVNIDCVVQSASLKS
jgi:hypothetical protein